MSVNQNARPLRVLLVGRHFWPHASFDAAGFLGQLAVDLHRSGLHVEVVTPRYAASWPEHFHFREIPVHRPAAAPRSDWSMGRYVRHLATWLKENSGSFDLVLVDSMREESQAVIEAASESGIATVLICGGHSTDIDPAWWQSSRSARRCVATSKEADAIVVKNAVAERMMLAQGFPQELLQRIEIGFTSISSHIEDTRSAARVRLAAVNSDLTTMPETPVVLCTGRMQKDGAMNLLANAVRPLIARRPDLRFWFVGDGPHRQSMYDFLRGEGVRHSIAMPGSFVDISDLMLAADVFFQGDHQGLDFALPAAVAAALPIVAIETPEVRSTLTPGGKPHHRVAAASRANHGSEAVQDTDDVTWLSAATSKSIRVALNHLLDNLPQARLNALQLRRDLVRWRPQAKSIEAYIDLVTRVVREKSVSRSRIVNDSNSIEAAS